MCTEEENPLLSASPTVFLEINGVLTGCVCDTGAETSLIPAEYYVSHLANADGLAPVDSLIKLVGANNLEIPVLGVYTATLSVAGHKFDSCFLVKKPSDPDSVSARRRKYPVLLGCNILRKMLNIPINDIQSASTDWGLVSRSFDLRADEIALRGPKDVDDAPVWPLHTGSEYTVVDSRSICTVKCHPKGRAPPAVGMHVCINEVGLVKQLEGTTVYVATSKSSQKELVTALPSLQEVAGKEIEVTVANYSKEPIIIPPGLKLGTAAKAVIGNSISLQHTRNGLIASVDELIETDLEDDLSCRSNTPQESDMTQFGHKRSVQDSEYPESYQLKTGEVYTLPPGVSLENVPSEKIPLFVKLLKNRDEAFSKNALDLGTCNIIPHQIRLKDDDPINLPFRRIAPNLVQEVKQQLDEMLRRGIIRKSCSPYASAIVPVRKKNGSIRICIDYRRLNAKTIRDSFPLPRIQESLEALHGSVVFSSLDLAHGYFQVVMEPDSVPMTAFRVPWGLFEFIRMPQGLVNSPATFQRTMEHLFGDLNLTELLIYLDDILVFSSTFEDHIARLDKVLGRLIGAGLKLNGAKCKFFQSQVLYLGHVVSSEGVAVDPDKVSRIVNWPTPDNSEQVVSFMGLASYYRRFIKSFSDVALPIRDTVKAQKKAGKPHAPFVWTKEADIAFRTLKLALSQTPVLIFPCFEKDFILEVDGSLRGLGACLSQMDEEGRLHPVSYASRCLRGAERVYPEYSSFKLELLALKWAVTEKFREYLLGVKCIVYTDHNPLIYLHTAKLGATEMTWAAQLAMFDVEIRYRTGSSNRCADALSRYPDIHADLCELLECSFVPVEIQTVGSEPISGDKATSKPMGHVGPEVLPSYTHEQLSQMQKSDAALRHIWALWDIKWQPGQEWTGHDGPLVNSWIKQWPFIKEYQQVLYRTVKDSALGLIHQLLVPKVLRQMLIETVHDKWGHQGSDRTFSLLKTRVYWPGMRGHVKRHVKACFHCLKSKTPIPTVRPLMRHLLAFKPMELVAMDFLKLDKGKGVIEDVLTITDAFSKWSVAIPCKDQTAKIAAKVLMQNWFSIYGVPLRLHSDQGRNFEGDLIRELCALYGITKTRTTAWHPQGNGQTERFNKTLCGLIKSVENCHQREWPDLIRHLVFMYNTTPHSVTGVAPYVLLFGREPTLPVDHLIGKANSDWDQDFIQCQADTMHRAWEFTKQRIQSSVAADKARRDRKANATPLAVGSRVLLKQTSFKDRHKLADHFGDQKYIITDSNDEQDLYNIRPINGGIEKWVNRKMLIQDPRIEVDPLLDLSGILPHYPSISGSESEPDINSESSSESDVDAQFRIIAVAPGKADGKTREDVLPEPVHQVPRRSSRATRGQHSNRDRLPQSVLG